MPELITSGELRELFARVRSLEDRACVLERRLGHATEGLRAVVARGRVYQDNAHKGEAELAAYTAASNLRAIALNALERARV
jgi:hypothetical protein